MQRHVKLTTRADLRQLIAHFRHDCGGAALNVVVAGTDSLADSLRLVTTEASRILLEGVAASAITRGGRINAESHASAASVTSGGDDGRVARDELSDGEKGGERGGLHFDGL